MSDSDRLGRESGVCEGQYGGGAENQESFHSQTAPSGDFLYFTILHHFSGEIYPAGEENNEDLKDRTMPPLIQHGPRRKKKRKRTTIMLFTDVPNPAIADTIPQC
jgi:hypothetical protein